MPAKFAVTLILSLAAVSGAYAHESERIDTLEKELIETQRMLLDTRKRLAILESMIRDQGIQQIPVETGNANDEKTGSDKAIGGEGRKPKASWRELSKGMSMSKVLELIGDPQRVKGSSITTWYYENGGSVVFWDGYLNQWTLPN